MILWKRRRASCECLGKARFAPSMEKMSMYTPKRFVCIAIRPAQLSSRANYDHNLNIKASGSARLRVAVSNKTDNRQQSGLVRALGPVDATMIVMGSMIGSGIFITSAESARLIGAPGWLLLAWAVAGLMTITGALCCSELATMMPRAGGVYVFLREAYGPAIGFLFAWTLFLVIQTGTIAAVAIAFAKFLGVFVPAVGPENYLVRPIPLGDHYAISLSTNQLVAIALIALLTWTNTRGLEIGKLVQNIFTFAKTAALAAGSSWFCICSPISLTSRSCHFRESSTRRKTGSQSRRCTRSSVVPAQCAWRPRS